MKPAQQVCPKDLKQILRELKELRARVEKLEKNLAALEELDHV